MRKFITSEYYELKDVHEFNLWIRALENEVVLPRDNDVAMHLLELEYLYKPFDKIQDFVPGSPKYIDIMESQMKYRTAQAHLKELAFTTEKIAEVQNPNNLSIYKHTYTLGFPAGTRYEPWDDYEWNYPAGNTTYTFFSTSNFSKKEMIVDFKAMERGYVRVGRRGYDEGVDLIQQAIDREELRFKEELAYRMADRLKVRSSDISLVFDIQQLAHYSGPIGGGNFVVYKDPNPEGEKHSWMKEGEAKRYYDRDVLELIKQAKIVREKRYVKEDRFVEYPRHTPYIEFLKQLASGEYKEYQYD